MEKTLKNVDDSKKISLDYIFSHTLAAIYKISLKTSSVNNNNIASIL